MKQRIVCAAILFEFAFNHGEYSTDQLVVTGVRHYDKLMHSQIKALDDVYWSGKILEVQGFVDNKGNFLTREEAFIIAKNAYQIIRPCGNPNSKELFSENLY